MRTNRPGRVVGGIKPCIGSISQMQQQPLKSIRTAAPGEIHIPKGLTIVTYQLVNEPATGCRAPCAHGF